MTTPVSSNSSTTPLQQTQTTGQSSTTTPSLNMSQSLGQDAFLKLLVTQLQNQDPLQPQNNSQMIAQLAQFSSLEQMTNVAQTDTNVLSTMQSLEAVTSMSFAHQLLGTQVQVTDSNGQQVSGQVSAITMTKGQASVVVNGTAYSMAQVVQMS